MTWRPDATWHVLWVRTLGSDPPASLAWEPSLQKIIAGMRSPYSNRQNKSMYQIHVYIISPLQVHDKCC